MRVTIDATSLLLRSAGVKTYVWRLLVHLRQLAGDDAIRAFPRIGGAGDLRHDGSVLPPWPTLARIAALHASNILDGPVLEWLCEGADVFHASNQVHHAPRRTRLTATIHDLTCWIMPEFHTAGNIKADRRFADRILRRADGLIAVSEHTRQDAIRVLGIDPDSITTIHSGVGEAYFNATAKDGFVDRPYVLYVGTIEPRKNVDRLLDAWMDLPGGLREEFRLAIAGPAGWGSEQTMARLDAGLPGVRRLGYVPESDLPALTAGARAFAYPSLYEGFGFPVAQSMAAGVPVLTSNVSALPEVAGDAAILVDPLSTTEIRAGLERLLTSPSERTRLSALGRARAQRFRWEDCARRSLEFFERVAGKTAALRRPPAPLQPEPRRHST